MPSRLHFVEQHPQEILRISHQPIVPDHGIVVHRREAAALAAQPALLDQMPGVERTEGVADAA